MLRRIMIQIKGYIKEIKFYKPETGYTVLVLVTEDGDLTCVGNISRVDEGESIEVFGDMTFHPSYGEQLKIDHYETISPDDPESLKRYLGSGAIRGIGEALAARIVKTFGNDTMRILEEEPERLSEVKGISDRKAREIAEQFHEKSDARSAFMFLQEYGLSNNMAIRIYEEYGNAIYSIMKENPYRLAEDIRGIGFKMADEIAAKVGIGVDSEFRIKSGILYCLLQSTVEGHMYLPKQQLISKATELLGIPEDGINTEITNLAVERKLMIKQVNTEVQIYAYHYYYAELHCASMLRDLNLHIPEEGLDGNENFDSRIELLEESLNIELDVLQREAVKSAATNGVLLLSGGPGTGKTTTINALIHYFLEEGMDILLAAPTGRAAKRMTETTGYEAKTIHRMLELSGAPDEDRNHARFERNEDNPLEADVIIVDEMSMVDIFLFQALLKAIIPGTRLIMVGDVDQLPSVGPGQVLKDMMTSNAFPKVVLETIFRQSADSDIVVSAHDIRIGKYPSLDNDSKDLFFLPRNDVQVIYKHMVQLMTEKLPKYVGASEFEIQVLTPMRKGSLGVDTLNSILQKYVNPADNSKAEIECNGTLFREGDKVMQIKNNYQMEWIIYGRNNIAIDTGTGIFNGDMGRIIKIDDYSRSVFVEFDENKRIEYTYSQLEELELAYAVTIHKSQGSEYPAVILPLLSGPRQLFNRNLLYTALTRAKSCVTILGSENVIHSMIDNDYVSMRYTGLLDRICEVCC